MRWKDFFPNFGGCAKNQSTRAMAHLGVLLRFRGSVTHPEMNLNESSSSNRIIESPNESIGSRKNIQKSAPTAGTGYSILLLLSCREKIYINMVDRQEAPDDDFEKKVPLAATFRNLGLTLHGTSFAAGMARFHIVVATSLVIVASFARPTNAVAAGLVSFVEDSTGCRSVVHLALAYLLAVWFHVNLSYIVMVMATREGGYDNSAPRTMLPGSAALGRLKAAADNTQDSLVQFLVAVAVLSGARAGDSLEEEAEDAVKRWAVLAMLARTAYPIAYVLDFDLLRTMLFGVGFFSYGAIVWTAL